MAEEQKDMLIRQIQNMARGLGKFMGTKEIKDIMKFEEDSQGDLADEDLESIILVAKLEEIAFEEQLSVEELSQELNISIDRVEELMNYVSFATPEELQSLYQFVE